MLRPQPLYIKRILLLGVCLKVLLISSNHSTDFDVHHNWLAITYSTPISNWYFAEKHSIWTLDYPPFFAYFQYILSQIAVWVDNSMVQLDKVHDRKDTTVYFQGATVILTDLLLGYATYLFLISSKAFEKDARKAIDVLIFIVFNGGLLLVDHVHFQYNGYLLGLLVLCFHFALKKNYRAVAATYCVLVLSKHLFVPLALPFGVYLIRAYCFPPSHSSSLSKPIGRGILDFLQLVSIAIFFLSLAFGPFLLQINPMEQLQQIFSRLFPFKRGLVHAYWAPNMWAIYSFFDRFMLLMMKNYGNIFVSKQIPILKVIAENFLSSSPSLTATSSLTSGLVGDTSMEILPDISALSALSLVFLSMLPSVYAIFKKPVPMMLIRVIVNCSFCSFIFGYHVHEKAILVPLIPLALIAHDSHRSGSLFIHTSLVGVYSLFPLFTNIHELPVKCIVLVSTVVYIKSRLLSNSESTEITSIYNRFIFPFTVLVIIVLFSICEIIYPSLDRIIVLTKLLGDDYGDSKIIARTLVVLNQLKSMEFIPLMLTSTVCGTMCIAGWFYSYFLLIENVDEGIFPRTRKASLGKVRASISDVTHSADHFDSRGSILRSGNNDDEGSNSNSDHGKFDVNRDSAGSANSNDENEIVRSGGILKDVDDKNNNNSSDCIQVKRKPSGNRVQFKL